MYVPVYGTGDNMPADERKRACNLLGRLMLFEELHDSTQERALEKARALHGRDARHAFVASHLAYVVPVFPAVRPDMSGDGAVVLADGLGNCPNAVSSP